MQSISIVLSALISREYFILSARLKSGTDYETRSVVSSRPSGLQQRKPDGQM